MRDSISSECRVIVVRLSAVLKGVAPAAIGSSPLLRPAGMVGADDFEDRLVEQTVRGEQAGPGQGQRAAAGGGDATAGLGDEEGTGGEVPWRELVFEVGPVHPQADPAQVERRGTAAADAVDRRASGPGSNPGSTPSWHPVVVEAGTDEDLVEPRLLAHPGPLGAVKGPRPRTALYQSSLIGL